jgi:hypothetical protein
MGPVTAQPFSTGWESPSGLLTGFEGAEGYSTYCTYGDLLSVGLYGARGEPEWERTYGPFKVSEVKDLIQTRDGGYLIVGN